jgi:hypothetical protein
MVHCWLENCDEISTYRMGLLHVSICLSVRQFDPIQITSQIDFVARII